MTKKSVSIVACCLFIVPPAYCQLQFALSAGVIENFQDATNQPQLSFYPEMQVAFDFSDRRTATFSGSLYWGYWDDGVEELSNCADCYTFSFSSHTFGFRIGAALNEFPVPLTAFAGFSRQFIEADYIGGGDFAGNVGTDFSYGFNAFEAGLLLHISISEKVRLGGRVLHYFPATRARRVSIPREHRSAFGVTCIYKIW